ncbi:hypothetical protein [Priestia megaterium]|uniref:Uncharacterized protein n=1 Tax=Priestia megaterium TaxID=1404 RepID=A0A6M6E736_PRIMG|nr:hypothetical protein [Priestia megaterium]QJX80357.1 hypothetical protein FDZ14_30180 [Priestia megaterium]
MKHLEIKDLLNTVVELERHLPKPINLFNLYIEEVIDLGNKGRALENTDDERNYSYDIQLLINKVALVKPLLDGSDEVIYLKVSDMWPEAQNSLKKILSALGIENITAESDYDNGSWVLQKKYPDLTELIAEELVELAMKISSLKDTDDDRNFAIDITMLLKNFSEIESLIKGEKEEVMLDMNMWEDAQNSFLKVLELTGIEDVGELSNYDHHEWVFRKKSFS